MGHELSATKLCSEKNTFCYLLFANLVAKNVRHFATKFLVVEGYDPLPNVNLIEKANDTKFFGSMNYMLPKKFCSKTQLLVVKVHSSYFYILIKII